MMPSPIRHTMMDLNKADYSSRNLWSLKLEVRCIVSVVLPCAGNFSLARPCGLTNSFLSKKRSLRLCIFVSIGRNTTVYALLVVTSRWPVIITSRWPLSLRSQIFTLQHLLPRSSRISGTRCQHARAHSHVGRAWAFCYDPKRRHAKVDAVDCTYNSLWTDDRFVPSTVKHRL